MQIAFFVGRIIFGLYWLRVAFNHVKHANMLAGYAGSKNVPTAKLAVVGTGILALLGGLSIILGLYTVVGISLLVVFLVGVSFKMHPYWTVQDPQAKMSESVNFMKNVALIASLLIMLGVAQSMWMYPFGF